MQPVSARALKRTASLAALALLALVAITVSRTAYLPDGVKAAPEITSAHRDTDRALADFVEPAPFIRTASRQQTGLRGKPPSSPAGKAHLERLPREPTTVVGQGWLHDANARSASEFIAQRALGPRAPPRA